MKNLILGIFVLIFAALASCKVDVDPTTDINTVEFSIKTEDGGDSLAKGAKVYIYSSEDAYKKAYSNYDISGTTADTILLATNGKVSLDLNSKKTYWVRVLYSKDTTIAFNSGKIPYSNDEMPLQFGPFENNNFDGTKITTYASITLSKAYSFLVVAAKDTSTISVDVYNSIGNKCKVLNKLSKLINSKITDLNNFPALTGFDSTTNKFLVFVVPKGKIKIYYNNSLGCVSTTEKYISGAGSIEKELLEPCTSGNVVFYNKTSGLSDIKVVLLNPSDTIATLSGKVSDAPSCGQKSTNNSFVSISRPLGVYYYIATSKSGNCESRGLVTIANVGQCVPVEIKMCK